MEQELTTLERIKTIQSQLKIAIQNHHLLYLKKKLCPSEPDIQNHMNLIQGLILSMGRNQASLLAQFKHEIIEQLNKEKSDVSVKDMLRKHLSWNDVPKNIPIYKDSMQKKKTWGTKSSKREAIFRKPNKLQSLLKINNEKLHKDDNCKKENEKEGIFFDKSKIKIVYSNKNRRLCNKSLLGKNLQSVLKSKNKMKDDMNGYSDDKYPTIELNSEPTSPSSIEDESKSKSPSQSDSHSDTEAKANKITEKKLVKKLVKKKKKNFASTIVLRSNGYLNNYNCHQQKDETTEIVADSIEDIPQEGFMKLFGLVSRSQSDALKIKRLGRKRRSVAGQSNFYNDYFQASSLKRQYTSRKSNTVPSSPNNQVTVETATDLDDEDDKSKTSLACIICNLDGVLETCATCSEVYHSNCLPEASKGCPTCNAPPPNIKSIVGVGADTATSEASSCSDVIKRYLVPNGDA